MKTLLFIVVLAWPQLLQEPSRVEKAKNVALSLKAHDYQKMRADFDESLKAELSAERLDEFFTNELNERGELVDITDVHETVLDSNNMVMVYCKFERNSAVMELTFDKDDHIFSFFIK